MKFRQINAMEEMSLFLQHQESSDTIPCTVTQRSTECGIICRKESTPRLVMWSVHRAQLEIKVPVILAVHNYILYLYTPPYPPRVTASVTGAGSK